MARSLKERYDQRKLQQLQERAHSADRQLLAEANFARLLLEKMDPEDLEKVAAIVDKLDTLKTAELPHLTAAIEKAQAELNKYTAGGPLTKAWAGLKSKVGIDNPVVKVTTFADALERGFSQIPTILKNNGVNLAKVDLNKSLASTLLKQPTGMKSDKEMGKSPVTGKEVPGESQEELAKTPKAVTGTKSDQEMARSPFTGKAVPDQEQLNIPAPQQGGQAAPAEKRAAGSGKRPGGFSASQEDWFKKGERGQQDEGHKLDEAVPKEPSGQQKMQNILTQLRKALSPGGIFGIFKKVPYIDSDALAKELMAAPLKTFSNVAKKVQAGTKASEIAPDLRAQIQGGGAAETKQPETTAPTKPTDQTEPTRPTEPTTTTTGTTGTGKQPPTAPGTTRGGGGAVRQRVDKLVADSGAKDRDSAYAVIRHLIKLGLIDKNKLGQSAA